HRVEFVGLVDAFEAASNGITKSIIFFRRLVDRKVQISNRALNVMVTFKDWHDVQSDAEKVYSLLKEEMRGFLDFERPDLLFKEGMNLEKMREHVQADERFAHLDQIQVDKIEKEWKNLNLIPQLKDCIEEMEVLAAEVPKDAKWTSLWTGLN
ncbi:hypothetical protein Ocin01_16882, partial [Orchesella cincta]